MKFCSKVCTFSCNYSRALFIAVTYSFPGCSKLQSEERAADSSLLRMALSFWQGPRSPPLRLQWHHHPQDSPAERGGEDSAGQLRGRGSQLRPTGLGRCSLLPNRERSPSPQGTPKPCTTESRHVQGGARVCTCEGGGLGQ